MVVISLQLLPQYNQDNLGHFRKEPLTGQGVLQWYGAEGGDR